MVIKYFGHACFLIKTNNYSVCIDPYGDIGLKEPSIKADYYFCSHEHYDHNNYKIVEGAKPLDSFVNYKTINTFHDKQNGRLRGENKILVLNEEYKVVHLGDLGENLTNQQVLQEISYADVLLLPIGGKYTIDFLEAISLIEKVKPKVVIPMHYKINGSTVDIDTIDNFIKNVNFSIKHTTCEIDISSNLKENSTQIIVLEVA